MDSSHKLLQKEICIKSPFAHPTVMIRKDFFNRNGFYNEKLKRKQDYHLWVKGVSNSHYANIRECLLQYRVENSKKNLQNIIHMLHVRFLNFLTLKNLKCFLYMLLVPTIQLLKLLKGTFYVQSKK
jgi:hypothetical protein